MGFNLNGTNYTLQIQCAFRFRTTEECSSATWICLSLRKRWRNLCVLVGTPSTGTCKVSTVKTGRYCNGKRSGPRVWRNAWRSTASPILPFDSSADGSGSLYQQCTERMMALLWAPRQRALVVTAWGVDDWYIKHDRSGVGTQISILPVVANIKQKRERQNNGVPFSVCMSLISRRNRIEIHTRCLT